MCESSTGSLCFKITQLSRPFRRHLICGLRQVARISLGLLILAPAAASAGELIRSRCYMDTCSWFSVEETALVGTSPKGALFKAVLKGWQSHHPNGRYERKAPRQGGQANTVHVFCSKTMPSVIVSADGGRWQVDTLALNTPYGPAGALESVTTTYYAVCHATAASDPEAFIRLGQHFGYPALDEAPDSPVLARPEDILKP